MDNNNLPVELGEPVTTPLLTVYRFRVYKVQKQHFFEQTVNNRCKKFRVYGDKKEFCEVRIYFDLSSSHKCNTKDKKTPQRPEGPGVLFWLRS